MLCFTTFFSYLILILKAITHLFDPNRFYSHISPLESTIEAIRVSQKVYFLYEGAKRHGNNLITIPLILIYRPSTEWHENKTPGYVTNSLQPAQQFSLFIHGLQLVIQPEYCVKMEGPLSERRNRKTWPARCGRVRVYCIGMTTSKWGGVTG